MRLLSWLRRCRSVGYFRMRPVQWIRLGISTTESLCSALMCILCIALGAPHGDVADVTLVEAFEKTLLIVLATVPMLVIAASASSANNKAYSVRSCPFSSLHKHFNRLFISFPQDPEM